MSEETPTDTGDVPAWAEADESDRYLDLVGKKCPNTFVHAKMALEELEEGNVLSILVDHREAVDRLPRNMKNHGQEVVNVRELKEGLWNIQIRRRNENDTPRWILMDDV